MKLELKENPELFEKLSELYKQTSLPVDQIMNENQRQWGSPEAMLITVPLIAVIERLDKLIGLLEPKCACGKADAIAHGVVVDEIPENSLQSVINTIFVKPRMRAKDISKGLPEGVTIKMLMEQGLIKKENPFVYTKV